MNVSCLVCVLVVVVAVELHLSNEGGGCKGRGGRVIPKEVKSAYNKLRKRYNLQQNMKDFNRRSPGIHRTRCSISKMTSFHVLFTLFAVFVLHSVSFWGIRGLLRGIELGDLLRKVLRRNSLSCAKGFLFLNG